jgi:uncharacterized delta-60 repeat protein
MVADLRHIKGETMQPKRLIDVGVVEFASKPNPAGLPRTCCRLTTLLWAICLVMILVMPAYAGDGALDPSFIIGPGPYAGVQIIPEIRGQKGYPTVSGAPYNGYSLLYGTFWGVNVGGPGPNNNGIARLTNTGALDTTFKNNQMLNGEIRAVYIYPHDDLNFQDKILIGGSFSAFSGSKQYNNFARLNADGTIDETFPQTQWGGAVTSFGVQGSGNTAKILVGGYSIRVGDMDNGFIYQLIRLNYDGNLDNTYTHWGAPGGYIHSIKILPHDDPTYPDHVRIFCSYPKNLDGSGGTYYMLLLNSNAALPTITPPVVSIGNETVDSPIFNMAQQSDGKWVIGGTFANAYNSNTGLWVPRRKVARFNVDRSLDTIYDIGTGPNGVVTQISPMSPTDDRMVLAGDFTAFNGVPCGYLVRLTTTGSVDSFNSGTGADDRIMHLNWNSDGSGGTIFGYFRRYNGQARGGIAGLNADGSYNGNFANVTAMAGWQGQVYSLATQKDGKILIGGNFNGVGGKYRGGFARLNPNGSLDTSFKGGVDGMVRSVAVQADGKILLGGDFGQCNGFACTSLARLNPDSTLDKAFKPAVANGTSAMSWLTQVVPLANGQMMIAGDFYSPNGGYPVARLNSDGTKDPSFDASHFQIPGTNWFDCHRLVVAGSNYLIAGAWDTDTAMNGGGYLARLTSSGVLDTSFGPGTHIQTMDGGVADLLVQPDGKIVASGSFTHIVDGAAARPGIARFSANGLLDGTFTPSFTLPSGANILAISAMAGQPNGKILIQEQFLNIIGYNSTYISTQVARLNSNGSLDPNFTLGNPTNGWFYLDGGNSILRLPNGKALIGGNFSQYNGTAAWSLVRIFASPANFSPAPLFLLMEN